jgi:pyruvate dehydrogenase E2 component (dihydrolipoamide acetyltransferase)
MPIEILMPALSPTMSEGTLGKWLKKEGDNVRIGEVIAEIETDKATMEFEVLDAGMIGKLLVAEGTQGIAVDTPIALLLVDGDNAAALASLRTPIRAAALAAGSTEASAPSASRIAAVKVGSASAGARVFASPLARRIARESSIDISSVAGSGLHGRIVLADVERAKALGGTPALATVGAAYREIPWNNFRTVAARRMTEAKQTIPHFYLTIDCNIDNLLALRAEMNDRLAEEKRPVKVSVNDFVIRAVALALRKVPAANASFAAKAIRVYTDVDISVAVATPNGLITPIIRRADEKSLLAISVEMKELAARARDGRLLPEEFQGGSFSISNLGMYGVKQFEAIINAPQACIMAVGAGEQRPVVKHGTLAVAVQMSCTLSVDHRVVDGALGAEFLQAFRLLIEEPLSLSS